MWDVDSTEWTVKDAEDFINLEDDDRILLFKFIDVNIAVGLGEALMVMDQQRLDAGEHVVPDEDTGNVRPHSPLHVLHNTNEHHRATRRAMQTTLPSPRRRKQARYAPCRDRIHRPSALQRA